MGVMNMSVPEKSRTIIVNSTFLKRKESASDKFILNLIADLLKGKISNTEC